MAGVFQQIFQKIFDLAKTWSLSPRNFNYSIVFVRKKYLSGKRFVRENFRHLTKISSIFPGKILPDKVIDFIQLLLIFTWRNSSQHDEFH